MTKLESKVRCILQAINGPEIKLPEDYKIDYGCSTCTYDEKNKECPDYKPLRIYYYEVKKS